VILFFLSIYVFIPRDKLYFVVESTLAKNGLYINESKTTTGFFDFKAYENEIVYAKNKIAQIKYIGINGHTIAIKDLLLTNKFASLFPPKIESISCNLLTMSANAKGEFGIAEAKVDIQARKLLIELTPSNLLSGKYKNILTNFKKSQNGRYSYELPF
jgi:hypothetical protein